MNKNAEIMEGYAGYCEVKITDPSLGITFPMIVMYPADSPEQTHQLGPYPIEVAKDAAPRKGKFSLVIISHGSGGSPFVYRSIALHLARSGFIVGLPEHPNNNRNDNSLEGTVTNLTNRPRHLCLAADWFSEDERFKGLIESDSFSVIGHSMGGYTALAVAGGVPTSFPNESPYGQPYPIKVTRDRRIRSLVLLAPASVWFRNEGALSSVNLPILMMDAQHDPYTPPFHAQIVLNGVADPRQVLYRTVENAGHFSFLSPFPSAMISPAFIPSQDPPGFDRLRFHETLQAEIAGFLSIQH
ncbi:MULTISPECIES: alpha/beta hydrolase family protein [Paenibacillus]|uniref:alpha/beta hydrolase family protein n=2 Tax=Paenibacillus TaxID=44249 RepID=UPI0004219CA5|nr:alpha/beta hydrolase family protein [Paenibacillus sp. MAEPY1]KGP80280.1 alpha/beta hydrolase family protein [Paenibacillus sp. MAEPY2]OZQ59277.1 alpha/beta hydrolase [Paenibacillus taichungensis]HBU82407.1 alpha/beta hydrolase [Paenibacillus sp.]